ncbi:phage baseplate assembly protein V [Paraburkholderia sp. Cpub6]|uniref:phage baseplate assembly protein V n=1 Tax=Paraburkholderia sp. Cpub6 TaxID=2723094 RepID=UPI00181CBC11|nr:phage baseplate assembly protein V [Paraburkholderia sp. Cpub6]MBB5462869.1 phage baseplate assembly protein V [Paraburkholderia sp. Cpub6]
MLDQLNRLARRILLLMARGTIALVDDTKGVQTLQVRLNPLELIPDVPRYAEYGFTSNPPAGSQSLIAFKNGDRNDGFVIATSNAKYRMTALASGEIAIHDNKGQSVYLSASGIVVNGGGNPITLTNAPEVIADTPLLKCKGDILDNYETNTRTVAGMREVANSHVHPINDVQTGGSTINTQPPTQQE